MIDYAGLIGSSLKDIEGRTYNIKKQIGEGAQGAVFETVDNYIIKINIAANLSDDYASRYKWLMRICKNMRDSGTNIIFPIAILAQPFVGYVMHKVEGYNSLHSYIKKSPSIPDLSEWYYLSTGGLSERLEIGLRLAKSLRKLHLNGYAHCDLSPNNILTNGRTIKIIDSDNIASGQYKPLVIGTDGYIAPELYKGLGQANSLTDTYSFATILFQMLTLCLPYVGDFVDEGEAELEIRAFKGEFPYIGHPFERENESSLFENATNKFLTDELKQLFEKMFVDGLNNTAKRPTLLEFIKACQNAKDIIVTCDNEKCHAEFYHSENNICPECNKKVENIVKFRIHTFISASKPMIPDKDSGEGFVKLPHDDKIHTVVLQEGKNVLKIHHFDSNIPIDFDEIILGIIIANGKVTAVNCGETSLIHSNYVSKKSSLLGKNDRIELMQNESIIFINADKDGNLIHHEAIDFGKSEAVFGKIRYERYASLC